MEMAQAEVPAVKRAAVEDAVEEAVIKVEVEVPTVSLSAASAAETVAVEAGGHGKGQKVVQRRSDEAHRLADGLSLGEALRLNLGASGGAA
mmetsp:Transcript_27661/g.55674  ORF Transcript_27661/g.55674 Transcript_27661/m.55674 type:complete len:91 (-) Transcript_27661:185-457(-)